MALPDRLSALPAAFPAGDTVRLTRTVSGASAADGGVFTLALAGPSVLTVTGAANGSDWDVTLTAAQTTALTPGTYQWVERLTESSVTRTVAQGVATVTPDLFSAAPGETTTWEERTLAVVESALSNTLASEMKLYMIGGRQVQSFTPKELMSLRNQLKATINAQRGHGFGTPIRFDVVMR